MVEFLKRSTLADHGLVVEENNTSYDENERKYLGTLSSLPAPPKRKKIEWKSWKE